MPTGRARGAESKKMIRMWQPKTRLYSNLLYSRVYALCIKQLARYNSGSAMPTTLHEVETNSNAPLVTAYSSKGFALQGAYVLGSVALLPRGYFHWNIKSIEEICNESFALFHMVVPRIDLLIVGTGSNIVQLDPSVREFIRSKGIGLEVQDTPSACATFNYLLDDMRLAAAALIPPQDIS